MDWISKVVLIKEKLTEQGLPELADRITAAQMMLGTPGEMFLEVMHEIRQIEKVSPNAYRFIEPEVQVLVDYAKSIGYSGNAE
jgi:hypothetical protein